MPRHPDLPCAGCGAMLWRGSTSLPDGKARCRKCRENDRHGTPNGYRKGCRCRPCTDAKSASMRQYSAAYRAATGRAIWAKYRRDQLQYGSWIGKRRRLAIYERDGWECKICGDPVDPSADPITGDLAPSLDHIVARSVGGDDSDSNLRCAHRVCNSRRGVGAA